LKNDDQAHESLVRLSLRLPATAVEHLRQLSFAARRRTAEVARTLVIQALDSGVLPAPAPPVPEALGDDAKRLIATCLATISNLSQLANHANAIGGPFTRLTGEAGPLTCLVGQVQALGLELKAGGSVPSNAADLALAADMINDLAKRLNIDPTTVPASDWHTPLLTLKTALAENSI
jgi:hypothetical protein